MKKTLFASITLLIFLIGCAGQGEKIEITSPFIGGVSGLSADFIELRPHVFDGGRDPFDIIIKIQNNGETEVKKENIQVKISGINPAEFGKLEEDLKAKPADDLTSRMKDAQETAIPGAQVFLEFRNLNHITPITGGQIELPLRADICYLYKTKAISKLCIRENILNPAAGGICEITETKPLFNSGAPVQFADFKESARSIDKIGFSFEIRNAGTGDAYGKNTVCDKTERKNKDAVYIKVDTNLAGLSCTGLETKGKSAEGYVTMFGGTKIVTCTQTVATKTDFEQMVTLEAEYDYESFKQTSIQVKSSGTAG